MPDQDEARQALLIQEAEMFERLLARMRAGEKVDVAALLQPLSVESQKRMRCAFQVSSLLHELHQAPDEPTVAHEAK